MQDRRNRIKNEGVWIVARGEGPDPVDIHVGERIRLRRAMLRQTQQDLAGAVGISFQQLQKYERGTNRVSASRLFDIANHLGVSISFFFQDMDEALMRQRGAQMAPEGGETALTGDALRLMAVFNRLPSETARRRVLDFLTAAVSPGQAQQTAESALD